jgi:hypothetical protein
MLNGYYRKWYGQMQIYLLMFNYDKGLFILKRKQAKQLRVIEVELNYEYAEGLLKKAEIVNAALKKNKPEGGGGSTPVIMEPGNPPDFLGIPRECKKCPFFTKVCNPPLDFGDTVMNLDDEELEEKLERREELDPARKEFAKLDKEVKGIAENFPNMRDAFCGDFHIEVKEISKKKYEIPEDVKVQYQTTGTEKRVSIKRIGVVEA